MGVWVEWSGHVGVCVEWSGRVWVCVGHVCGVEWSCVWVWAYVCVWSVCVCVVLTMNMTARMIHRIIMTIFCESSGDIITIIRHTSLASLPATFPPCSCLSCCIAERPQQALPP